MAVNFYDDNLPITRFQRRGPRYVGLRLIKAKDILDDPQVYKIPRTLDRRAMAPGQGPRIRW